MKKQGAMRLAMQNNDTMRPTLTYILPDKMGGVFTYVRNLMSHRGASPFAVHAILTRNQRDEDERPTDSLPVDREVHFHYGPLENLYAVIKRLYRQVPPGPGVIVTNDWLELAMLSVHDPGKMVVNISHGDFDYYYDLARRHERVVDVFIGPSKLITERLREAIPHRSQSVLNLPHGVPIPVEPRSSRDGNLRAIFVGRLTEQKHPDALPAIDRVLHGREIVIDWTVVGTGPLEQKVREAWRFNSAVQWTGNVSNDMVLRLLKSQDIFVLPSKNEGFPVTLMEAAAAGVIPIVTDLPSGVPEIVIPGETGYRAPFGDIRAFALAIETLHRDRNRLEMMSKAVRALAANKFDINQNIREYDSIYSRFEELRRKERGGCSLQYGSRLDRPWIPNLLVRTIRSLRSPYSAEK
jgi:glycosyltransferase involved in cell wall biosynthesis